MKIAKLLLICLCCAIVVPLVGGQAADSAAKPGTLQYLDPRTGAFHAIASTAEQTAEMAAASIPPTTGKITVTFTINNASALTNYTCTVTVAVADAGRSFGETGTAAATGTGGTRNCVVKIPYAWPLLAQPNDSMVTSYVVTGTTGTNGLPQRGSSLFPFDVRKVPANGVPTNLTAAVTD